MTAVNIRPATVADAGVILGFVTELAIYEKAEEQVTATLGDIESTLFGPKTTAYALICSVENVAVGFAVYFFNYSTWLGKRGLYLEDLYVAPQQRSRGLGKAVLKHLANVAIEQDCGRFEWSVIDWNEPAIRFYEALGAKPQSEWVPYRLDGKALSDFAKS